MRMIRHDDYMIVDKDWLFKNNCEVETIASPMQIQMDIGIFEDREKLKVLNYPHCFKVTNPWMETESLFIWEPCDIDEMLNDIEENKTYLTELEESVKNFYEKVGE